MKQESTTRESRTDWARLGETADSGIDLSDIPKLGKSFFKHAKLRMPKTKRAVSLRLDPDVLAWFRGQGKGYQTRINAVLRMYMEAHTE